MVRPRQAPLGKNGAPGARNPNEIVVISGRGSLRLSEDGFGVAGPRIGDSAVMRRSSPNNFHFVRWDFFVNALVEVFSFSELNLFFGALRICPTFGDLIFFQGKRVAGQKAKRNPDNASANHPDNGRRL